MGKDIYKKGLILLGVIVVVLITFLGYKLQSKDTDNVQPYNESEAEKSEEEINQNKGEDENSNQYAEVAHIFIDISGAVKNPGIYELNEGMRLNDAIEAAGGITEDINSDYAAKNLNKARILSDEEKIYIPFKNDDLSLIENNAADDSKNTNSANTKSSKSIDAEDSKININVATKEQLTTLKGIGDAFAQRIIDYRQEKKFAKIEDIKNVKGIGEKTFENIKGKITVK